MNATDYFYGIDIGGTKMELVACDASLTVRHRQRVATPGDDFGAFVAALAGLVEQADDALGARGPVGLGVPGIIDSRTQAHLSANVACLRGRRLQPVLAERLQREVVIGNDCQCFALSEANGGAAGGAASMLGLILGTGAGAGYVVDGRLVRGLNGAAGEWGHWPLAPALLQKYGLPITPCACGASACLECYVSGTGVRALHAHFARIPDRDGANAADATGPARPLAAGEGADSVDAAGLAARLAAGDALARRVFDAHLDLLGSAIARIVLAYDPHVIVLGGGLSRLAHLYTDLPAAAAQHLIPGLAVPPIVPPAFGDAGGARGAALLAHQATRPYPNKES